MTDHAYRHLGLTGLCGEVIPYDSGHQPIYKFCGLPRVRHSR